MPFSRSAAVAGLLCAIVGAGVSCTRQRETGQSRREPQFENDQVTVWKSIVMPNQPLTLHRHDHARTLIALTDGRLRVVDGSGKILDTYNLTAGKAMWLGVDPPGQMHADVNDGTTPVEVIVVQMKNDR